MLLSPAALLDGELRGWNRLGGRDATTRAGEISEKTLEEYVEPEMDPGLKDELKAYVDRRRTELGD